jgi:NAD(P)-dependent dehydrogenase (short-subunit alcohol dehydrogenase family)
MQDFSKKSVVITGGATGIGFGLAKKLGSEGAKIIIAEPREEKLKESVAELASQGVDAQYFVCDVTDFAQVEALADFTWETHGSVDAVFNNAGVGGGNKPIIESNIEDLRAVFEVNFFGVWNGCKVFGQRFVEQGTPAVIVNTGSENSLFNAVPNIAGYQATKHAVLALTDALREQMPDFIQVSLIIPGFVASDMTKGIANMAMDADTFAGKVVEQVKGGQFYIVTHPFNIEHIEKRYGEITEAFEKYAPRYEGDEEHDVRTLLAKMSRGS